MIVKRYTDIKVIWFLFGVVAVFSIITMYFGTIHRFTYASKYENYVQTDGRGFNIQEYEHEDSEDNIYWTYSAEIGYAANGKEYTKVTADIFSEDNVPDVGEMVTVLYYHDNPDECVVAKYDWMSRTMIPQEDDGDSWLFVSLLLIGFTLIVLAMAIESDRTRELYLGCGLTLMGIDGIVMGIIMRNFLAFFLVIFGAVGVFVLYRYFRAGSRTDV